MTHKTLCRILAAATLLTLLARWRLLPLVVQFGHGGLMDVMAALSLGTIVLGVASAVGIWRGRRWGFVAFYVFAVLFTLLFGAALIPYILQLIPLEARVAGIFAVNGLVLAVVAVLHWKRPRQGGP